MVREIPLTQGKVALVDDEDYAFLMQWKWYYNCGYAKRGARGRITMHGTIMPSPDGTAPDHRNGNGIDNRRDNLRPATPQQNMWNRKAVTGSKSKYKGVDWYAASGTWRAYIKINGKQKHLGCYREEQDAARAYNIAAKKYHGEFARLNPVEGEPAPRVTHPYQHEWHKRKSETDVRG